MAAAPELARSSPLGDLKPQPQLPQRPRFSLGGQVSVMASSNSNSNSDLALAAAAAAATSADLVGPMTSSMIASSVVNRARSTSSIYNAVADEFGAVKSLVRAREKCRCTVFCLPSPSRLNDCNNNDLTFLSFKIPCLHVGSARLIS